MDLGGFVSIEGEINGVILENIRDVDATLWEASAELQLDLYYGLFVSGGYHSFNLDAVYTSGDDKFEINTVIDGYFFSVGFKF
jgi:L-rhamnose isomerase